MGSGRRRMKQMQGLLLISRLDESKTRQSQSGKKPQRATVVLHPQMLQLFYSSLDDQDMLRPLGHIDLRDSKLEQVSDGFIIYETRNWPRKSVKLQDQDKATTDAWFFAVYTAISEHERLPISADEIIGHKFSAVITSSILDEHTEEVEYEISCQLVLPARPIDKPYIKWKVWKTFSKLQTFDDVLRVSYGAFMTRIMFPRDRKRDLLLGSVRKKSLQGVKEQQLALYIEQVCHMPEISTDSLLFIKVKQFLEFDSFYEIASSSISDYGMIDHEGPKVVASANPMTDPPVSIFAFSKAVMDVLEPPLLHDLQSVGQSATEPLKSVSNAHLCESSSSTESLRGLPTKNRRSSFAALEDEGEEFVEVIPLTDLKAAKRLHRKIVQTVRELVSHDEERVQEFQDQTKDFGRDKMSAMEYCAFLLGAVGAFECCQLISDMAKLLPDEVKRGELIQARAAIWRRTHRRQRRRSKQFSESVMQQKEKEAQQNIDNVHSKMRPKSDSFSIPNRECERIRPIEGPVQSSVVSRRLMPDFGTKYHSQPDCSAPENHVHRAGLADPRRHLNRRASFNTMFSETVQTNLIEEENPAENESDDDGRPDQSRTQSKKALSNDRKVSLKEKERFISFGSGLRNSILLDDDDGGSSEDDEEKYHSNHYHHSRNRQQSGSGSDGRNNRIINKEPLSRVGLTRLQSRQNSSFVAECDEYHSDENSHLRFRRSQRRASRKFYEEAKSGPAVEEENPVLARLKKQGAVNFMMQLH